MPVIILTGERAGGQRKLSRKQEKERAESIAFRDYKVRKEFADSLKSGSGSPIYLENFKSELIAWLELKIKKLGKKHKGVIEKCEKREKLLIERQKKLIA